MSEDQTDIRLRNVTSAIRAMGGTSTYERSATLSDAISALIDERIAKHEEKPHGVLPKNVQAFAEAAAFVSEPVKDVPRRNASPFPSCCNGTPGCPDKGVDHACQRSLPVDAEAGKRTAFGSPACAVEGCENPADAGARCIFHEPPASPSSPTSAAALAERHGFLPRADSPQAEHRRFVEAIPGADASSSGAPERVTLWNSSAWGDRWVTNQPAIVGDCVISSADYVLASKLDAAERLLDDRWERICQVSARNAELVAKLYETESARQREQTSRIDAQQEVVNLRARVAELESQFAAERAIYEQVNSHRLEIISQLAATESKLATARADADELAGAARRLRTCGFGDCTTVDAGPLLAIIRAKAGPSPQCSGEWLSGSGGHRVHGTCSAQATWTHPDDPYAYCDGHIVEHDKPNYRRAAGPSPAVESRLVVTGHNEFGRVAAESPDAAVLGSELWKRAEALAMANGLDQVMTKCELLAEVNRLRAIRDAAKEGGTK